MGKNAVETTEMLHVAFLRADSGKNTTFELFSKFKSGMNSTENASCSGQPSTNEKITMPIE
jgi:hypothetical protein